MSTTRVDRAIFYFNLIGDFMHMDRVLIDLQIQNKQMELVKLAEESSKPRQSHPPLKDLLLQSATTFSAANLGGQAQVENLKSSIGSVSVLPEYKIKYPDVVIKALSNIYEEYNREFISLVSANRESEADYQYAHGVEGLPENIMVQIDMIGLPEVFLCAASGRSEPEVREALKSGIFEIENSLAMYQLLEKSFAGFNGESLFKKNMRQALDEIRAKYGKPIAILAVTEEKLTGIKQAEFGKPIGQALTNQEVTELSGFDALMGPEEFKSHLAANDGECQYLLYVRSSEPIAKLKAPSLEVHNPLLADPEIRRIIKANSLTFNVDAPDMKQERRINDTKAYMLAMDMAYGVNSMEALICIDKVQAAAKKSAKPILTAEMLSDDFRKYLAVQNIDANKIVSGEIQLRAKPLQGTYGCYGHVRGGLNESSFRGELNRNIKHRGAYVVQPELATPKIRNNSDGVTYTYIDRNFLSCIDGKVNFMGGFRSMIPVDSVEAIKGRVHGSRDTIYGEIMPESENG